MGAPLGPAGGRHRRRLALATIGALAVSIPLLGATTIGKRLAKIGLTGGIVSVGALVLAGGLYAAGIDVAGACGGG